MGLEVGQVLCACNASRSRLVPLFAALLLLCVGLNVLWLQHVAPQTYLLVTHASGSDSNSLKRIAQENAMAQEVFHEAGRFTTPRNWPPRDISSSWSSAPPLWRSAEGPEAMEEAWKTLKGMGHREGVQEATRIYRDCKGRVERSAGAGNAQVELMKEAQCRAAWRHLLQNDEIVGVGEMLGFLDKGKKGAIRVQLASGIQAFYKPCGAVGEWPEMEVVASSLNEVLGWHKVAPAVMRSVPVDDITNGLLATTGGVKYLVDHRFVIVGQEEEACATDGVFRGSMIGWWDGVKGTKTMQKTLSGRKEVSVESIVALRHEEEEAWLAQTAQNHIFLYILGTLRHVGYNEYVVPSRGRGKPGSHDREVLIALDLDRSNLEKKLHPAEEQLSLCFLCKVHKDTYRTLEQVSQLGTDTMAMVQRLLYLDGGSEAIFLSDAQAQVVSRRIRSVFACLQHCEALYGSDDVVMTGNWDVFP